MGTRCRRHSWGRPNAGLPGAQMRLSKRRRTRIGSDPGSGWSKRKGESEYRSCARLAAFDHDAPAVPFSDLTADVEAQPGARHVAEVGVVAPMEPLKHEPMLGLGNPDPVVGDAHDPLRLFGRYRDRQPGWTQRIGQSVVDQVVQDTT